MEDTAAKGVRAAPLEGGRAQEWLLSWGRGLQGSRQDPTERTDGGWGLQAGDSPGGKGSGAPPSSPILCGFSETVKRERGPTGKGEEQGPSHTGTFLKPLLR